jgi:uncharacterized protein YkwD
MTIRLLLLATSALALVSGCQGGNVVSAGGGGFVTATQTVAVQTSMPSDTATTSPSASSSSATAAGSSAPTSSTSASQTPPALVLPPPADTATNPVPPPAPPEPTLTEAEQQEARVLELTNKERAAGGCPALVANDQLAASARGHSADMAAQNYFDHKSKDGRTFVDRIKAAGYPKPGAENIAAGQPTAEAVMDGWMKSPGHKANILNCGLKALGVGVAKGGSFGIYWTQNFGW